MSNSELVVKIIGRSVLNEILAIENEVHVSPWSQGKFQDCFDNAIYRVIGLYKKNRMVGYAVLLVNPPEAELHNIAIDRDLQNCGVGKVFLNHLIAQCVNMKIEQLFLEVRESNIAAINLYQNSGFTQVGLRKNYYQGAAKTESALLFMLDL